MTPGGAAPRLSQGNERAGVDRSTWLGGSGTGKREALMGGKRVESGRRRAVAWIITLLTGLLALGCSRFAVEPGVAPLDARPTRWHAGPPLAPPRVLDPSTWGHRGNSLQPGILTDPGELPRLEVGSGGPRLPLEHTHVSARVVDFVAEVEVTQTYGNPYPNPIEVVYVFPLPENSAVHHLQMEIGRRVIIAEIRERETARREYEVARAAGHTAALLEQERPNVFTQSVTNIAPGEAIDVVVRYMQDLTYDNGSYEFVFPMVVGPRHAPGAQLAGAPVGRGTKRDTTRVGDASRITPPYLGEGQRSGHDISLDLRVDSHLAITGYESPTHDITTSQPADGTLRLQLAPQESMPNRDFVLRYTVAGLRPQAHLYVSPEGDQGRFFSLVVVPPLLDVEQLVGEREFVFVVDRSGSMTGVPLALARQVILECLAQLRPVDTFNVLSFSGSTEMAFATPRHANRENVLEAMDLVSELGASGVTEMANAVELALEPRVENGRHRYVFFLTDGEIGDEREVVAQAGRFVRAHQQRGKRARVFGLGVGAAPNRHLIDALSQAGNGIALYASVTQDARHAANRFFHYVDRAVMTDVRVEWGSLVPSELQPGELPDLFATHPVIVHGRFTGSPIAPGRVLGRVGDREVELPIVLHPAPHGENRNAVLAALWARAKIGALEQELAEGATGAQAAITQLGIDFHLVTPFTSLVAVDRSRRVGDGRPRLVVQPVAPPSDVDVAAAGGDVGGGPVRATEEDEYGYSFDDDPLSAGGFGPQDATLRMRREAPAPTPSDSVDAVRSAAAASEELGEPPPPPGQPEPSPPPAPQPVAKKMDRKPGRAFRAAPAPQQSPGKAAPAPSPSRERPLSLLSAEENAPAVIDGDAVTLDDGEAQALSESNELALGDQCEIDPEACPQLAAARPDEPVEAAFVVEQSAGAPGCACDLGGSRPNRAAGVGLLLAIGLAAQRRRRPTRPGSGRREASVAP